MGMTSFDGWVKDSDGKYMRLATFECQCGCGKLFFATYKTRYPRYASRAHKMRAYRARKAAEAQTKAARAEWGGTGVSS